MVTIEGPENRILHSFDKELGRSVAVKPEEFTVDAETLGEAILKYCQMYGSEITPYDGSFEEIPLDAGEKKYFFYDKPGGKRFLVDIHIHKKNGSQECPKQNLSYKLVDGDWISIGMLVC